MPSGTRKFLFFSLLFFCTVSVFSQSGEVFAPFISRLEAELRNGFIRLSWEDSPNIQGPVFIYRSESPITNLSPANLPKPAEVPYGAKSYIDEVEKAGTFHYFAAASDEQGRKYLLTIPFTNTLSVKVEDADVAEYYREGVISAADPSLPARAGAGAGARNIEKLSARVEEDAILVTYTGDGEKNAILYRSVRPIKSPEDLLSSLIIQQSSSLKNGSYTFIDLPVPGIPCYYALLYEEDVIAGNFSVRAGINSTTAPAVVPLGVSRIGLPAAPDRIRTMPLPMLNIAGRGIPGPSSTALGPEASRALSSFETSAKPERSLDPAFFPEDLETLGSGEGYQLSLIVQGSFLKLIWGRAAGELKRFLDLSRSEEGEYKARFYLGQCYYFTGKNREALFEFLAVQEHFPNEAGPWVQAVLRRLAGNSE
jgi:hypothetical protein